MAKLCQLFTCYFWIPKGFHQHIPFLLTVVYTHSPFMPGHLYFAILCIQCISHKSYCPDIVKRPVIKLCGEQPDGVGWGCCGCVTVVDCILLLLMRTVAIAVTGGRKLERDGW